MVWVLLMAAVVIMLNGQLLAQESSLTTRWTAEVTADNVHSEYPRPQMVREDWLNLNGLWQYALTAPTAGTPATYDGEILVPFPIESLLSGVQKQAGDQALWYRRTVTIPETWPEGRILLHFGAVDWGNDGLGQRRGAEHASRRLRRLFV